MAEEIAAFLERPLTDATRDVIAGVRRPADFERVYEPPRDDLTDAESQDIRRALDRFGYGA